MQNSPTRRIAVVISGFSLATGLMGAPGSADTKPVTTGTTRSVEYVEIALPEPDSEQTAVPGCREPTSSVSGAWLWAKICWSNYHKGGWLRVDLDGRVHDTTGDGEYAEFLANYKLRNGGWETFTAYLASTEGEYAPTSAKAQMRYRHPRMPMRSLWVAVCKSGGDCDRWR
ncbi:hypothetical protein [Nocardiopsis rhodophaea]|uniref:hypothetical protein n=1 Tax=Nocardiopsis rhodophaea TaxID=280238 RepID=UPI0031DEAA52